VHDSGTLGPARAIKPSTTDFRNILRDVTQLKDGNQELHYTSTDGRKWNQRPITKAILRLAFWE
jgi:hypothetical protein